MLHFPRVQHVGVHKQLVKNLLYKLSQGMTSNWPVEVPATTISLTAPPRVSLSTRATATEVTCQSKGKETYAEAGVGFDTRNSKIKSSEYSGAQRRSGKYTKPEHGSQARKWAWLSFILAYLATVSGFRNSSADAPRLQPIRAFIYKGVTKRGQR
jgi:hypothetical protein